MLSIQLRRRARWEYGLALGMVIVSLASTTAAALAFLIARYVARDKVHRRVEQSPKLVAVDEAIGEQGWKIVALLRLSPAVPFNLQNYLYGVTAVRFWPCVLASWIAMLPGRGPEFDRATARHAADSSPRSKPTHHGGAARGLAILPSTHCGKGISPRMAGI